MSQILTSIHGRLAGLGSGRQLIGTGGVTPGKDSVVNATDSTLAVTFGKHAGKLVTLNRAAGIAVTLPAASGSGGVFQFAIGTTVTSNSTTIKVANATDIMVGFAVQPADGGSAVVAYETASDTDTITFNGSTTGGIKGDIVTLRDVKLDGTNAVWLVDVMSAGTGTEATPFSATVS